MKKISEKDIFTLQQLIFGLLLYYINIIVLIIV